MSSLIDIILAKTDEEREAASKALQERNAKAPSDREIVMDFLKNCTDMQGAPLTLDDKGSIVTLQ